MKNNINRESITQSIVRKIGTAEFVVRIVPNAKVSGQSILFCCPFHGDKNPSLALYLSSGMGRCFGCGKRVDLVNLYAAAKGQSESDACREINKMLGAL